MSEIVVEEKAIATPGEVLANGMDIIPGNGTYRKDDMILANRIGLVSINGRSIKLIPLAGPFMPKRDDVIICKVTDITLNVWRLDTNSAFNAMLNVRDATNSFVKKSDDLRRILKIGDYIAARIFQVSTQKLIDVSLKGPGLRRLGGGQIIKYSPNKFPRIIGRAGSMVSMIKRATGCQIIVGQNGLIWLTGEPEAEVIAKEAIKTVEQYAHTSGLTDRIKTFLESKGLTVEQQQRDSERQDSQEDSDDNQEQFDDSEESKQE